jgi:hypothetical protein
MPERPSIKGSVFAGVVEDVNKSLSRGTVSREELGRWLEPGDLDLLDRKIMIADWYDIHAYTRMNEMLRDVEGAGSNKYLVDLGRMTARRLLEAGLYQQLKYLHRTQFQGVRDDRARYDAFGQDLRLLTTISGSILNFSKWQVKPDPQESLRYVIEVSEAHDFPEVLAWRSDGFVNEMATQHREPDLWAWTRPQRDLLVFRMKRPL